MTFNNKILNLLLMNVAVEIPINTCLFSQFESFIHRHQVYQHIRTPVVREKYRYNREVENKQDKNAIEVVQEDRVVGHIPISESNT